MKTAAVWRAGAFSDPGLQRDINEDRVFVDDARGVFMVVDGLGGHAAGETAAETAVNVVVREFSGTRTIDEDRVRQAITAANNEIYRLSQANPAWRGMACVLTLAVASGDQVLVGHVGDSRLYSYWNGKLQKVTCDHSPVGELEDSGELTEDEAMNHPRRNEVYRDVGSYLHSPDDQRFIEIKRFALRPDGALLICSDGLSDLVKSAAISRILERYDGDSKRIAQLLIEAANAAGGRDNISVVFIPGPEFLGTESPALADGRSRHATTRMKSGTSAPGAVWRNLFLLLLGLLVGTAAWVFRGRFLPSPAPSAVAPAAPHVPREIVVNAADSLGIVKALAAALPGDTISVPAGEYLGPLILKDRVSLMAQAAAKVIVRSDAASTTDAGIAVAARGVREVRLKGLQLAGDETHPLRVGLLIADSSLDAENIAVTGAVESGLRIEGDSHPLVMSSDFRLNGGAGVVVRGRGSPRLLDNKIAENGRVPGAPRAGIEIDNEAQPTILHNEILNNGLPAVFPLALDADIRAKNIVDPPARKTAAPAAKPPAKPAPRPRPVSRTLSKA